MLTKKQKFMENSMTDDDNTEQETKNLIMQFIIKTIDINNYNRMRILHDDCGFKNYEKFLKYNKKCVDELNADDATFMLQLIHRIKNNKICNCDAANFLDFQSSGIYFNIDKRIVIMNDL